MFLRKRTSKHQEQPLSLHYKPYFSNQKFFNKAILIMPIPWRFAVGLQGLPPDREVCFQIIWFSYEKANILRLLVMIWGDSVWAPANPVAHHYANTLANERMNSLNHRPRINEPQTERPTPPWKHHQMNDMCYNFTHYYTIEQEHLRFTMYRSHFSQTFSHYLSFSENR